VRSPSLWAYAKTICQIECDVIMEAALVVSAPKRELRDRAREAGEGECRQLLEIVEADLHPLLSSRFSLSPSNPRKKEIQLRSWRQNAIELSIKRGCTRAQSAVACLARCNGDGDNCTSIIVRGRGREREREQECNDPLLVKRWRD